MEKPASHWMVEPLRKYATFGGRARRAEYWWFALFYGLILIAATVLDVAVLGQSAPEDAPFGPPGIGLAGSLAVFAFLIPSIAVSIRRMHDLDRSGWWVLVGLTPIIGSIILLIWFCTRGTQGANAYGEDPLSQDRFFP